MKAKTPIVAFVIACMFACGCSRKRKEAQKEQASPSQAPANGANACSDYFALVSKCIETKVPEAERAEQRQNFENDRKMLESIGSMASQSCADSLRNAIQNDSYGCYADEAAKRGIQTPCTLLTRSELEQVLQISLGDGVHDGNTCRYPFPVNALREPFKITVHWKNGRDDMDAARGAQAGLNRKISTETGIGDVVPGAAVEGVGDDAFFTLAGAERMLSARRGDAAISLLGGSREQLIELARKALPRIQNYPDARLGTSSNKGAQDR